MNKRRLLTALLIFFAINVFSQKNSPYYYWSSNKKIEVAIDSSTFIFLAKDITGIEVLLQSIDGIKNQKVLRSNFVLVELRKKSIR